jgi:hypothetical protein
LDQATIPEPYTDLGSLRATAMATKQLVEALAGQRGTVDDIAITWGDLLRLGVIKPDQVPSWIGYDYPK